MTMNVYARVAGGVVMELISLDASIPVANAFEASVVASLVNVTSVTPQPQQGWTYSGGVFSAPAAPPAATPAQEYAALVAGGLAITSTGTPAVTGTYAIDDDQQDVITRLQTYIAKNGTFPGGLSSVQLRLANGAYIAIPSVTVFQEIGTAIGNFVADLDNAELTALAGGSWVAPSATATIA